MVSIAFVPLLLAQELEDEPILAFPTPKEEGAESRLLEIGRKAFLENRQSEATQAFTELLRINPNQVEALYRLAIINFQNKNYVDGLALIERAVKVAPNNPMPRLAYARALEEIDRTDDAIREYQYVLNQMGEPPDSPAAARADRSLGLLQLHQAEMQRDRDAVLEQGNALRGKYPTDISLLNIVGATFVRAGLYTEAEQTYQSIVALVPESPLAYFYLANVYEVMRNIDLAEKNLLLAQQKGPREELAHQISIKLGMIRGVRLLQRGDSELALKQFMEVQKLDPMNVVANGNIARITQAQGKVDIAVEAFNRVLKVDPGNLEAHFRLGLIYLDAKPTRLLDALPELDYILANDRGGRMAAMVNEVYARLDKQLGGQLQSVRKLLAERNSLLARLEQNPNDAMASLGLGEILQQQNKLPEAKERYLKAVESDPLLGMGYVRLAEIAERENDLPAAIDYYQRALAALTNDDEKVLEIQKRLMMTSANYHSREGHFDQAVKEFGDVLTKFGPDKSVYWNLALVTARQGNVAAAKDYYHKLLDMDPTYMPARFNLGLLLEQEEDEEQAIVEYRKILVSGTQDQRLLKLAADRLKQVQRAINGVSYQVGYGLGLNDNANIAYKNQMSEYSTQTSANVIYNYKVKKGVKFSFRFSPDYTVYHMGQYDFLTLSLTPSLAFRWRDQQWTVGVNRGQQSSVIYPEQSQTITNTFFGSVSWRGDGNVGYQSNFSYRSFGSQANPFFDANTYTLGIMANRMGENNLPLSYGYTLTINDNTQSLGNDYAYVGHGLNGRVDKALAEKLSGYLSGNMSLMLYSNPDSYSNFQKKRVNVSLGLGGGVNYNYSPALSFYASYDYSVQRSSLPLGYVYSQLQVIEALQSGTLGNYARNGINFGARYNF